MTMTIKIIYNPLYSYNVIYNLLKRNNFMLKTQGEYLSIVYCPISASLDCKKVRKFYITVILQGRRDGTLDFKLFW